MDAFCALDQAIVVTILKSAYGIFSMVKITIAFKCQQIDESSNAEDQEEEETSYSDNLSVYLHLTFFYQIHFGIVYYY